MCKITIFLLLLEHVRCVCFLRDYNIITRWQMQDKGRTYSKVKTNIDSFMKWLCQATSRRARWIKTWHGGEISNRKLIVTTIFTLAWNFFLPI